MKRGWVAKIPFIIGKQGLCMLVFWEQGHSWRFYWVSWSFTDSFHSRIAPIHLPQIPTLAATANTTGIRRLLVSVCYDAPTHPSKRAMQMGL